MFKDSKLKEYRKFAAAVVGGVAELVATGVLNGPALVVAQAVIAAATAAGVYTVRNGDKPTVDVQ